MDKEQKSLPPPETFKNWGSKKKKIIIGIVCTTLVIGSIGGCAGYRKNQSKETTAVVKEVQTSEPPIITLENTKIVSGMDVPVELQSVIKSITCEGILKEVLIEVTDTAKKDKVEISDMKEGTAKNDVPAKTIKFSEQGNYTIKVTVKDMEGSSSSVNIKFEIGDELVSYVKGLHDWSVEVDSKNIDFMDGVTFDKTKIKSVEADSSKVKLDKEGSYDLIYKIHGMDSDTEVTVKVKVEVVSEATAAKKADEGKQVVTSDGKVKKDSTGSTPTGEVSYTQKNIPSNKSEDKSSSGNTGNGNTASTGGSSNTGSNSGSKDNGSNSGSTGNTSKPSTDSGNKGNSGSGSSKPSTPSTPSVPSTPEPSAPKPSEPSTPSQPSHTHNWVTMPAKYENRLVEAARYVETKGAWDELVYPAYIGTNYGNFSSWAEVDAFVSAQQSADPNFLLGGTWEVPAQYVHHDAEGYWTQDKYEKVLVEASYEYCATCGQRR